VSYITTRSTGAGIVPFVISALCYAGTAVLMGVLGNLIDKKVRVIR
jgi:glutamate transport system permease protein